MADGDVINSDHIRMTRVPTSSLKHTSKDMDVKPMDLYKRLFDGSETNLELTQGGHECRFNCEKLCP